jgi:hypothetical protein
MLQNFLGSYIVLSLLAAIVIWKALAASNQADEAHSQEPRHTNNDAMVRMNYAHRRVFRPYAELLERNRKR